MDLIQFVTHVKNELKIKFLEIHLDAKFGSQTTGHRENIRKNIVSVYSPLLSTWEKKAILDLVSLPVGENLFFSISHTKSAGGYATCERRMGFDIEETSRISQEIINRMCSIDELKNCPDVRFLWSAKESSFKCISNLNLVSEVKVTNWVKISENFYSFSANGSLHGFICLVSVNGLETTLSMTFF